MSDNDGNAAKTPLDPKAAKEEGLTTASLAGAGPSPERAADDQRAAEDRSFARRDDGAAAQADAQAPLFSQQEGGELHQRWDAIQAGFVDEPRKAVEDADALVAAAMKRLAEMFANERSQLEAQWDRGGDVSTEDLRVALRRYRSFFGRLLEV